jgi:hypothetical protein
MCHIPHEEITSQSRNDRTEGNPRHPNLLIKWDINEQVTENRLRSS